MCRGVVRVWEQQQPESSRRRRRRFGNGRQLGRHVELRVGLRQHRLERDDARLRYVVRFAGRRFGRCSERHRLRRAVRPVDAYLLPRLGHDRPLRDSRNGVRLPPGVFRLRGCERLSLRSGLLWRRRSNEARSRDRLHGHVPDHEQLGDARSGAGVQGQRRMPEQEELHSPVVRRWREPRSLRADAGSAVQLQASVILRVPAPQRAATRS